MTRHTPLTNKQVLHYFELPKLPEIVNTDDGLKLWLTLFKAETEEDLAKIEALEVSVMQEAIGAYRRVLSAGELREIERQRSRARHNEASALRHARDIGREEGLAKGMTEGQIKILAAILEARFGEIPAPLRTHLETVQDDGRIETLSKLAATCRSLTEFQKELESLLLSSL